MQAIGNVEDNGCATDQSNYLYKFLPAFIKRNKIDCIISFSYYYRQDRSWQIASLRSHVPFIVLQKEITVDEGNNNLEVEMFSSSRLGQFYGNKLLVNTHNAKDVFVNAGACDAKDIVVTGHLRIDTLYNMATEMKNNHTKKQIVLFSFFSVAGGLADEMVVKGRFEWYNRHTGFSKLFEQVHCAMAEIAVENPDVDVVIKCKWLGQWEEMVDDAILAGSGLCVNDIPNLYISDGPASKYIEDSMVVISFCSTSTVESRLYGRPVIVPLFAEASGKYKRYVNYRKYFDDLVIATSKEDLKAKALQYIENEIITPPLDEMIKEYVTYFDGKIVDRVVKEIKMELEKQRQ